MRKDQKNYLTGLTDLKNINYKRSARKQELELAIATAGRLVTLGLNTRYLATIGTILATAIAYHFEVNQFYWMILLLGIGLHIFSAVTFLLEDKRIYNLKEELLINHNEGKMTTVMALKMKMRREIPTIIGNSITLGYLIAIVNMV
jgi:hypothetical protein